VVDIGDAVKSVVPVVIVPFQISCGAGGRCRRGHTNACLSVPFRSSYGLKPVCGVEYGGALSDRIGVPFADRMLVRYPPGHAPSQTAALADQATDGFGMMIRRLEERRARKPAPERASVSAVANQVTSTGGFSTSTCSQRQ
jgi:alcohol dehydrogenase